jgi:signal transduction histidine kinase
VWYAGTFAVILALLSGGMFLNITRQYNQELDESLHRTADELARVVRNRGVEAESARLFDSSDFRIPDRMQYLTDLSGRLIAGPPMPDWLPEVARRSAHEGPVRFAHPTELGDGETQRQFRVYAKPFRMPAGDSLIAIAAADEVEIEDRYASLIAAFGTAAAIAVLLVAFGGWLLARQSTAPVERSMRHMRRFMADAAHELRSPLTVLRSRAEVTLQRPRDTEDYVAALHGIERESVRLGRIVEDLLMLARADAGERPIERKRLFLDDLALDAAEAAGVIADRRRVHLALDRFEEAPVEGDAALLRQLLIILLDNAIKYTPPEGTVRVAVNLGPQNATLTVADTGIGIAAEHLPYVFDRFYRADPARSREDTKNPTASEGVGLGLSIARWIVEQHHAKLTLESQPGHGTVAKVIFPLAAPATARSVSRVAV